VSDAVGKFVHEAHDVCATSGGSWDTAQHRAIGLSSIAAQFFVSMFTVGRSCTLHLQPMWWCGGQFAVMWNHYVARRSAIPSDKRHSISARPRSGHPRRARTGAVAASARWWRIRRFEARASERRMGLPPCQRAAKPREIAARAR